MHARVLIILAMLIVAGCGQPAVPSPDPSPGGDREPWRLAAQGRSGAQEAFGVRAATDERSWGELWSAIAIAADRPEVDLDREVLVSFAHGVGSSCPELRLDEVVIDDELVYSVVVDPLGPRACTADLAGAVVFVVALDRASLPDDGFTLALREDFGDRLEVPLP